MPCPEAATETGHARLLVEMMTAIRPLSDGRLTSGYSDLDPAVRRGRAAVAVMKPKPRFPLGLAPAEHPRSTMRNRLTVQIAA